ncbi:hypothetical protein CsSME_00014658 [Camellia sinensis var. sinensis]
MASPLNNFDFPYFPSPPPPSATPPSHSIPPPPPHTFSPPPPHIIPPPPPPHTFTPPPPHIIPPPPPYVIPPPPPYVIPPPPPSSPGNHSTVREEIVQGPHGSQAVVLSIEDDVHIDEEIRKNEKFGEGGMHVKSAHNISSALEEGTSFSGSSHHHLEHKH